MSSYLRYISFVVNKPSEREILTLKLFANLRPQKLFAIVKIANNSTLLD